MFVYSAYILQIGLLQIGLLCLLLYFVAFILQLFHVCVDVVANAATSLCCSWNLFFSVFM